MEMTTISFSLSKQGIEEQAIITPTIGEVEPQLIGSNSIVWTGKASEVTLIVGETNSLHPEGVEDGSGQFDFTKIVIDTKDNSAGVADVSVDNLDNGSVEYYDLSGKRVLNPIRGIYLCRSGNVTAKLFLK